MSNNKSVKDLQKELNDHRKKSQKSRPNEDKKNARVQSIKQEIINLNYKLAELKYRNDEIQRTKNSFQKDQDDWQAKVATSRQKLKAYKAETQAVSKQLREALGSSKGVRRINDPDQKLKSLVNELASEKQRLRCDDLSTAEEKKAMRNIKVLEGQIEIVKKYQSQNVEEVFKQGDVAKANQEKIRKEHNDIFEQFKKAKDANTDVFTKLRENNTEQDAAKEKIKKLNEELKKVEQNFRNEQQDFDSWRRKEGEILNSIQEAREMEKYNPNPGRSASSQGAKPSTPVEKAQVEKEAAKEAMPTVKELRDAAQKEYEAIQAKLRSKQPTALPTSADPAAESAPTSKVADPHQAEKDLCKELIAYCKSNMPADNSKTDSSPKKKKKKRKKKIRLTHKPINFSNFGKVGVGIPIWSTDLAKCIKALEDKISSYDNPEETEDVKEQSV